jgi:hypothetical protein
MNQIKKQLKQYELNKQRIELMLKWTPLEMGEFQWQTMEEYILAFTAGDADALGIYGKSEAFRKWFVNQWNIRDFENIEVLEKCVWINEFREKYKHLHSVEMLIKNPVLIEAEGEIVVRVIDEMHGKMPRKKMAVNTNPKNIQ